MISNFVECDKYILYKLLLPSAIRLILRVTRFSIRMIKYVQWIIFERLYLNKLETKKRENVYFRRIVEMKNLMVNF